VEKNDWPEIGYKEGYSGHQTDAQRIKSGEAPGPRLSLSRIAKGFDFLGYSFEPKGLPIAPKTLANFLERIAQLYEQGADVRRIGQYVRNWWRWVRAGVELGANGNSVYTSNATLCQPKNTRS